MIQFTPIPILLLSWPVLGERPKRHQILGVMICIVGGWIYLTSQLRQNLQFNWHFAVPVCGLAANVVAALLGRSLNRWGQLSAKAVTVGSMGLGGILLLVCGLTCEPWPALGFKQIAILAWLVVVNTSLAFTWWNQSLQTLTTVESSVINNFMMIEVAIFAWLFLNESLTLQEVGGLALAFCGILIVQFRRSRTRKANA